MKNKYIYIVILVIVIIISSLIYSIFLLNNYYSEKIDIDIITNSGISVENKIIDITKNEINPNNYETFSEFIHYFNTGSGFNIDVDMENEIFFMSTFQDKTFSIVQVDKEFIDNIDKGGNSDLKSTAINDLFKSYKTDGFIMGEPTGNRSGIRILKDEELQNELKSHNDILSPYSGETFLEQKSKLENKKNKTNEDNKILSYIYDFEGDYKKSNLLKEKLNQEKIKYKVTGKVFNLGNTLKGAKIEVLNYDNIYTFTDSEGNYILEFEIYPLTRLRFRASYEGLSDGFNGDYVVFDFPLQETENINFNLLNFNFSKTIKKSDFDGGKKVSIKSTIGNEFIFNKGSLVYKDGKKYFGDFIATIYEFNSSTPGMENFLTLDNFDELFGYTGNMMITNGMTYLMLKDLEGNNLYVPKSSPIITIQKMDLEKLKNDNNINGIPKLKNEEIDMLVEISLNEGYPIDNKFLNERKILGITPWWIHNTTKGIWENVGFKLLNKDGLKEALYYNIDY